MIRPSVAVSIAACISVGAYFALPADAATCTWTGATNATWKTGSNWTGAGCTGPAGPPTNSTLTFPSGASNLSTNNNTAANSTYTIALSGSGYTLAGSAIKLGGDLTDSSASGGNTISLKMAMTAARAISVTNAAETLTVSGVISGAYALTKSGAGTLVNSATNTYTGITTISGGVLSASKDTNLGKAPTSAKAGSVTFTGGTLATTATYTVSANRGFAFTSTGTIDVASGTTLTYGGTAAGSGGLTLIDSGALVLSKANTYTGATLISLGTLQLGVANAVPNGSALTDNATFNLAGFADTIGSLSGTGTLQNSSATAATLTTNGNNVSTAFTGIIKNLTGTVALTKAGTGTLTLSGANTYTGTTTVSAGTLAVNGAQSGSAISLNGGTLTGSGTTGAITSTASGGTINPGTGSGSGALTTGNVTWSTGTPTLSVQIDGVTAGTNYNQLATGGTINVTNAKLAVTLGFVPSNAQIFTIVNNTGSNSITGTFNGLAEGASLAVGLSSFIVSYKGGSGHSIILTAATPVVALVESVSPSATGQNPGTDLAYSIAFTNGGLRVATNEVVSTAIPAYTDFKVGSAVAGLGTTGLSVVVSYSNNGGSTYVYTPASAGGGAPTGYDRNVTNMLWTFTGSLATTSPNNTGTVNFTARIR